jgi:hypothetical protein
MLELLLHYSEQFQQDDYKSHIIPAKLEIL